MKYAINSGLLAYCLAVCIGLCVAPQAAQAQGCGAPLESARAPEDLSCLLDDATVGSLTARLQNAGLQLKRFQLRRGCAGYHFYLGALDFSTLELEFVRPETGARFDVTVCTDAPFALDVGLLLDYEVADANGSRDQANPCQMLLEEACRDHTIYGFKVLFRNENNFRQIFVTPKSLGRETDAPNE